MQQIFYSNASFANPNKQRRRIAPPLFIWVLNRIDLPLSNKPVKVAPLRGATLTGLLLNLPIYIS